ncbi:MAG: DUF3168 domain-containing protein [Paracoccaceae bacterium]
MTMAFSAPLQAALYDLLTSAPELAGLEERIYDDAPHRDRTAGAAPYVTIGDETVTPWNTATERGAAHEAVIRVHAPQRGFLVVKEIAAAIVDLIAVNPPAPSIGAVISHEFTGARTRREEGGALRRIDLSFKFIIEDAV